MTERLYFTDAYFDTFEAEVVDVDGREVMLDRTAFYPTGGGQPHDTGWLRLGSDELAVTDVSGRDEIVHELEAEPEVDKGATAFGILDWERRFALMQYHTAQHLLSAVLLAEFDAETTGNQLYPDRARIDCAYPRFDQSDMDTIEELVNDLIEADHPVSTRILDREVAEDELDAERTRLDLLPDSVTEVRIVEIGEDGAVDRTACAGTHVRETGELPPMEITGRETKGSDEERLTFHLPHAGEPPA